MVHSVFHCAKTIVVLSCFISLFLTSKVNADKEPHEISKENDQVIISIHKQIVDIDVTIFSLKIFSLLLD